MSKLKEHARKIKQRWLKIPYTIRYLIKCISFALVVRFLVRLIQTVLLSEDDQSLLTDHATEETIQDNIDDNIYEKDTPYREEKETYVPPYVRNLPEGQHHSQEAENLAKNQGYELKHNQTYVREQTRHYNKK